MFISVLAYHILHFVEYKLRMNGDHRKWSTIRKVLSTHARITLSFGEKAEEGKTRQRFIRTCTKPEAEHMKIYAMFGLKGKSAGFSVFYNTVVTINKTKLLFSINLTFVMTNLG